MMSKALRFFLGTAVGIFRENNLFCTYTAVLILCTMKRDVSSKGD